MCVAHLFSDKVRMGCHGKPTGLQRLGPAVHASVLPEQLCISVHVRSQGETANGQGSVAVRQASGRWQSHKAPVQIAGRADVRCQADKRLFDGEARCNNVDNMTSARVAVDDAAGGCALPNREGQLVAACSHF